MPSKSKKGRMNYQYFSLIFGFSIWLVATLIFRYWGHDFFLIENNFVLASFIFGVIPFLYLLAKWVFNHYKLIGSERLRSSVLMAVPAMILDVACIKFHTIVFPGFSTEQTIVLGAWVIWVYSIVLLIGLFESRKLKL